MEKEQFIALIAEGKTQREIGVALQMSQTNVRYWLKQHGLVTLNREGRKRFKPHCCYKCGETDPTKFYGKEKQECIDCHNDRSRQAAKEKREYAVQKLGGKCANPKCGFDQYICSLDIHHLDPSKKDKNFDNLRGWSIERIDNEIKDCIVLCKNCHAAVHNGLLELNGAVAQLD